MAKVEPFRGWRYSSNVPLDRVLTQPYDKISAEMQERYYALHPQNIVRIVLGKTKPDDSERENVYARAAAYLREWRRSGVVVKLQQPAFLAYFQQFTIPGTNEQRQRKGFIGLGRLEDYENRVVFPHERTLSGPKQDRLQLLRKTRTHFEEIFMLYEDPEQTIDRALDGVSGAPPAMEVLDEYGVLHTLWIIHDASTIKTIRDQMADKKLIIADGHHRYETALAYRDECRGSGSAGATQDSHEWLPMTFFNMHSPGLTILPTHRVLSGVKDFNAGSLLECSAEFFDIREAPADAESFRAALTESGRQRITIGLCADSGRRHVLLSLKPSTPRDLDVVVLHRMLIQRRLGISEDAVRTGSHIRYVREFDAALDSVRSGTAQVAFLLNPTRLDQMRDIAYAGQVMPQKSTDFYPKILSGLVMYSLDDR